MHRHPDVSSRRMGWRSFSRATVLRVRGSTSPVDTGILDGPPHGSAAAGPSGHPTYLAHTVRPLRPSLIEHADPMTSAAVRVPPRVLPSRDARCPVWRAEFRASAWTMTDGRIVWAGFVSSGHSWRFVVHRPVHRRPTVRCLSSQARQSDPRSEASSPGCRPNRRNRLAVGPATASA